ncbi:MAG: glycosyltransferase family 4 protein, partial [Actinomycetota bacterium]|nr:glycosyltransferase family 4 protein [Actinomycetota bacterium]
MRTLVVTNDFPPRQGGIQTFVAALLARRPPESLVVLASRASGWEAYDAALPYEVVRRPTGILLPTLGVARAAAGLARRHGCDTAFFGAAAPLGLLAPALRDAGVRHLVGATHGHETGWVALPGARQLMRRIASGLDVLTYISDYTRDRLAPALGALTRMAQLPPGVDVDRFTPHAAGTAVRQRYGLGAAPVVACVSRLVPRKGQDVLVGAWPRVLARHPDARLLLVGG